MEEMGPNSAFPKDLGQFRDPTASWLPCLYQPHLSADAARGPRSFSVDAHLFMISCSPVAFNSMCMLATFTFSLTHQHFLSVLSSQNHSFCDAFSFLFKSHLTDKAFPHILKYPGSQPKDGTFPMSQCFFHSNH